MLDIKRGDRKLNFSYLQTPSSTVSYNLSTPLGHLVYSPGWVCLPWICPACFQTQFNFGFLKNLCKCQSFSSVLRIFICITHFRYSSYSLWSRPLSTVHWKHEVDAGAKAKGESMSFPWERTREGHWEGYKPSLSTFLRSRNMKLKGFLTLTRCFCITQF